MKKYIMYNKLSKKEQKKLDATKRKTWGDYGCQSPVTRIVADRKKQDKKYMCRGKTRGDCREY